MKTLIVFMSTHGCTIKIAHQIAGQLTGEVNLHNLSISPFINLNKYDRVIIGGSIHAGKIQRRITQFCEKNLNELLQKEVGLYICCMYEGDVAAQQMKQAFPAELHKHAKTEAIMGGEFLFEKMNMFERFLVKKITNTKHSVHKIDLKMVQDFTRTMEKTTA